MSTATAICFLLAGLSLVAVLTSRPDRSGRAMAGFWLAGVMALASIVFLLAYLFGMPLLYGGKFIPPAMTTSMALAALGAALLALAGPRAWASDQQADAATIRGSIAFLLVFVFLAIGLVSTGGFYYRSQVKQQRSAIERELSAIADLKVEELVSWRKERLGDATLLYGNTVFADLARRALASAQDAQARIQVHTWLRKIRDAYGYEEVSLVDVQGSAQISIPERPLAASELERAHQALRSGRVTLEDFHQDEQGDWPHLTLLVPILDALAGNRPLGVVMLDIDPGKSLYPVIERWRTLSASAETVLVRRDGDHVLFLNELRFRKNTALSLRLPLTRTEAPAVKAVLGQEGVVEGRDYRDVPVIAAIRAVRDTPWFLVARMDTDEFLASIEEPLWLTAGLVGALLLFTATALGLVWRHQRVRHYKERTRAADVLQTKSAQLDYLACYDVLTGLANRTLFLERVAQHMRSAVDAGHQLALFLVDLERFKNINDSLGRPAGDDLLKQVARWLTRNTTGDVNLLARVGADHFAVVMPVVKQDSSLKRLLEQWIEAVQNHPFRLNNAVFRITFKVGIALFPDDGVDADTLFKNAEAALKKAKASSERYLFYTPKMTRSVASQLTLENQLRQALDKGEFVLHYQPKVNLVSGRMSSAEALIRWNDPRTGLVPPGRFIPVLEETGLIYEVGRWALGQAITDYLRWHAAGLPAVRIAVNVSPLQLRHPDFIAEIKRKIDVDVHAAAGLELEITESLIMENVKHSIASLQAIRAMGVSIAIDDFGTGFSSLSYLSKFPVDTLKIDRSFVIEMTDAPEGKALVSTIISLAHSLKLNVVAEGVETEEQARLLRLLNCDEMQGYLFSKPLPSEIFETRFLLPPPAN